jgi:hypothetical protein
MTKEAEVLRIVKQILAEQKMPTTQDNVSFIYMCVQRGYDAAKGTYDRRETVYTTGDMGQ